MAELANADKAPDEKTHRLKDVTNPVEDSNGPFKKLRYSEPDLQIVLTYSDEKGIAQEAHRKVYAAVLASQSSFIDTALSTQLKEKSQMIVTLKDVQPEIFDLIFKTIHEPTKLSIEDVLKILPFSHMYQFRGTLKLCDLVLSKYFKKHLSDEEDMEEYIISPESPDVFAEAAIVSDKFSLPKSKPIAKRCIIATIRPFWKRDLDKSKREKFYCSALIFSFDHMKRLHPTIRQIDQYLGQTMWGADGITEEEVNSLLFPRYILDRLLSNFSSLHSPVEELFVNKTYCCDGIYKLSKPGIYKMEDLAELLGEDADCQLSIQRSQLCGGNWAIVSKNVESGAVSVEWFCHSSSSFPFPPLNGQWESSDRWVIHPCDEASDLFQAPDISFRMPCKCKIVVAPRNMCFNCQARAWPMGCR